MKKSMKGKMYEKKNGETKLHETSEMQKKMKKLKKMKC